MNPEVFDSGTTSTTRNPSSFPERRAVTRPLASIAAVMPVVPNHNVPRGVVWAPFNQSGAGSIEGIIDATAATTDVRIERI